MAKSNKRKRDYQAVRLSNIIGYMIKHMHTLMQHLIFKHIYF